MEIREVITFAGGTVDRAGLRRRDEAWLSEVRLSASTRLIAVRHPSQLLVVEGSCLARLEAPDDADLTFLGVDGEGNAIFACEYADESPDRTFEELRALVPRHAVHGAPGPAVHAHRHRH